MSSINAYLIAVLGVVGVGCGSVVILEVARPEGYNSQAAYTIVGICTTVLTVLLGIIKSIGNGAAIEEAKQTAAVAAVQAKAATVETVKGNRQVAELKETVESSLGNGKGGGP